MSNLQKVVYLTQAQYETLANGGSVTTGGVTLTGLNNDYLYLTTDNTFNASNLTGCVSVAHGGTNISSLSSTDAGKVLKVNSAGNGYELGTVSATDTKVNVVNRNPTTKAYLLATTTAPTSSEQAVTSVAESAVYLGTESGGGHLYATAVHNAVWNDYAEYRAAASNIEPGRVVVDTDNGEVILATQRLQPGAQIVSDTWGHIMGETVNAKTPLAVAGRVLVYPYKDRKEYHAGMCVCSAPNGTVDIMTRDEIKEYPDCIIGTVSEIPDYEYWGSGRVRVNERIWVKVK